MHKIIIKTLIVIGTGIIFTVCAVRSAPASTMLPRASTNLLATALFNTSINLPTGDHLANQRYVDQVPLNICQACHPGPLMQRLREIMVSTRSTCGDCHNGMSEVKNAMGIPCLACHGSRDEVNPPPATRDNEQYSSILGLHDPIIDCEVCHTEKPEASFSQFGGGN